MDLTKTAVELIFQFLDEHSYKNSIRELIKESGIDYDGSQHVASGRLISLIDKSNLQSICQNDKRKEISFNKVKINQSINNFASIELLTFRAIGDGSNVLISLLNREGYLISGCSNKKINVLKLKCPILSSGYMMDQPRSFQVHSGGVLALDIHPKNSNLIASGSMDYSVVLSNIYFSDPQLCKVFDHTKFVVRVKWSPSGYYLVSSSYDKSFILYKYDEDGCTLSKITQRKLDYPIEGLSFKNNQDSFIISLRNSNYILGFSIQDDKLFEDAKINLNQIGDDHISFNALDISFSPDDRIILVSTDRHQALLIEFKTGNIIGRHYGFIGDELSQPRHCWHPDGCHFYEACQDNSINVVSVSEQNIVRKLIGHTQLVV